jgi:hypothetical protein
VFARVYHHKAQNRAYYPKPQIKIANKMPINYNSVIQIL